MDNENAKYRVADRSFDDFFSAVDYAAKLAVQGTEGVVYKYVLNPLEGMEDISQVAVIRPR